MSPEKKSRKMPVMACPLCDYVTANYFHAKRVSCMARHLFDRHLAVHERTITCPCCKLPFRASGFGCHFHHYWKEIFAVFHAQLLNIQPEPEKETSP